MSLDPVSGPAGNDDASRARHGRDRSAESPDDGDGRGSGPGADGFSQEEILDLILAARVGQEEEPPDDEDLPEDDDLPEWDYTDPEGPDGDARFQAPVRTGFAAGGMLDGLAPGPTLASMVDATHDDGLNRLNDDELIGFMRACRRMTSRAAAKELAAIAELARRRPAEADDTAFGNRLTTRLGTAGASKEPPGRPVDPAADTGRASEPSGPAAAGPARNGPARNGPATNSPAAGAEGGVQGLVSPFASDELAAALTLTVRAAETHMELAMDLAEKLPGTAAALETGVIDLVRARIIADATHLLTREHAAAVEARVLPRAGRQTSGQLRAALARAVLAVDPDAARRRQEKALQDARVMRWREDAGTAALCGRDLPSAEVLAADQRITARASELRSAGITGTMDELRARAYLDFLLGRDAAPETGREGTPDGNGPPTSAASGHSGTSGSTGLPETGPGDGDHGVPLGQPAFTTDYVPPGLAARINVVVPLATLFGLSDLPGEVAAFGPVDAETARRLAAAAGGHPATRWCVTVAGKDGRPLGHGCARGRHAAPASVFNGEPNDPQQSCKLCQGGGSTEARGSPGGPGSTGRPDSTGRPGSTEGRSPPGECGQRDARPARRRNRDVPGHDPLGPGSSGDTCDRGPKRDGTGEDWPGEGWPGQDRRREAGPSASGWDRVALLRAAEFMRRLGITVTPLAVGTCDHRNEEPGYTPSRRLRHLIRARNTRCSFPGCRRPAVQCDLDHTVPYESGGRTCECNLAPLCRRHHRCKQSQGWQLDQPEPGILTWRTPAGRTYVTTPTMYPL
jgi:hypothetical protein